MKYTKPIDTRAHGLFPATVLLLAVTFLAFIFANVEIQIEGAAGWAANLPTWRINHHWLLDIFWGGRAMTGYHAWVFPFIAIFFHFPIVLTWEWSFRIQARIFACVMFFWVGEDFLWFVLNPAYGIAKFAPAFIPWHIHWLGPVPTDYWSMGVVGSIMFWWSYRRQLAVR